MPRGIIAAAGSGKTEYIVTDAISRPKHLAVLVTTYTDNGTKELRRRIIEKCGSVPDNITVISWFSFLLRHGIKPYQNPFLGVNVANGLNTGRQTAEDRRYPKKDEPRYYLDRAGNVYRDFASDLTLLCDDQSQGAVMRRISNVFPCVYFDEVQDLSGRDFEVFERLLRAGVDVTLVGDPRQGTFSTTNSRTNKSMTRSKVGVWLKRLQRAKLLDLQPLSHSHRCIQTICDLSDSLYPQDSYPEFERTLSLAEYRTDHDGPYLVREADVPAYWETYRPQLLVWNNRAKSLGIPRRNMGEVKGLTFPRVLVQPTIPIEKFFQSGSTLTPEAVAKLYVAITRARHSVAIIINKPGMCTIPYWQDAADGLFELPPSVGCA